MRRSVGLALAVLIIVLLASARISDEPLWMDEVSSIQFASRPVGDLVHFVLTEKGNMGRTTSP